MESGKADPNAQDQQGRTALHEAATGGHAVVLRALLEAKADPDAKDITNSG